MAGGLQSATASFDGDFISPEIGFGTNFQIAGVTIQPSARIRYARASLDGFTETGSAANLTVSDRDIELWQCRVQVAFPITTGNLRLSPRIGVEGSTSDDDTITGTLLGQAVAFNAGGDDNEVSGLFLGASASAGITDSVFALVDVEVPLGEEGIDRTEIRGGIAIRF